MDRIKQALRKMQGEIKQSCLHEALLYNSLYAFRVNMKVENTRHHLFDNIETNADLDGVGVEFTEEDLG